MCSFSIVTWCLLFSATISLLCCLHLCFCSCDSVHGALHLFSPRLAGHRLRSHCEARSYTLGHRGFFPLSWHTFFFPSVLGSGSLNPVQDCTRHSVRLVEHLVSEAPARLETREAQVTHIVDQPSTHQKDSHDKEKRETGQEAGKKEQDAPESTDLDPAPLARQSKRPHHLSTRNFFCVSCIELAQRETHCGTWVVPHARPKQVFHLHAFEA